METSSLGKDSALLPASLGAAALAQWHKCCLVNKRLCVQLLVPKQTKTNHSSLIAVDTKWSVVTTQYKGLGANSRTENMGGQGLGQREGEITAKNE